MKLIPILLRGNLTEDLQYSFGAGYPITKGDWQVALKTVAFHYTEQPTVSPLDLFLYLSCNYVEEIRILPSEEKSLEPAILSLIHINLKGNEKKVFSFAERDFFSITSPTKKLLFYIRDEHNNTLPRTVQENLNVTLLLLFRRKN